MIKSGDVIKHEAFLDVAVQVHTVSKNPETGDISITGMWINQGQVRTYVINEPASFSIKEKHIENWSLCEKPTSTFVRNEKWRSLQ